MEEYLTTGKASPRSERTEVQCAYEVIGGRLREEAREEVPLELPTQVPTQIISYTISISLRLLRKYLDIQ